MAMKPLTLLQHYAKAAVVGLAAHGFNHTVKPRFIAALAFDIAEAMVEEDERRAARKG